LIGGQAGALASSFYFGFSFWHHRANARGESLSIPAINYRLQTLELEFYSDSKHASRTS
jgi:hypothetical protein